MPSVVRYNSRQVKRVLWQYVFLTPQLLLFLFFIIIPFFLAIPTLFTDQMNFLDADVDQVGFSNLTRIFTDPNVIKDYWPALGRTARFTVLNYLMVYAFGLTLALLVFEIGFKRWSFTMIYLPYMVSGLALGYMATMLFSQSTGTLNLLLTDLGWIDRPIDIKSSTGTTLILPILNGWKYAGFNMAIFLSGLMTIPGETIEAAIVDGAAYWQRLVRVYFPQMIPSFIMATVFCLLGSFNVFDILVPVGALHLNEEAKFVSVVFFTYGFLYDRLALAMALAVETFIPLIVLAVLLLQLQKRLQYL
jgi:multiple sugar transport system permease protein